MTREKRAGRNTVAAKKKKKKYRGFWIFVKVQFVLSLLVLGGLGYYVLGGYASEVNSIPQGSGQCGTEFHGGDVPEIPHKRCVCG